MIDFAEEARRALEPERPPRVLRTMAEWLNTPSLLEPPPALFAPVLYEGRSVLLASPPKFGKSTLAGQLAAALTRGGTLWGRPIAATRVLFYSADEPPNDTLRRLKAFGADSEAIVVHDEAPLAAELRHDLEVCNVGAVIFDTFGRLAIRHGVDVSKGSEVGPVFAPYVAAIREAKVAGLFLAHTTKAGTTYKGAVEVAGLADAVLDFRIPRRKGDPEIAPLEDDEGPPPMGARIIAGMTRWGRVKVPLRFDGTRYHEDAGPVPLGALILEVLARHPEPLSVAELAAELNRNKQAVSDEVGVLHEAKQVHRDRHGVRLPEA